MASGSTETTRGTVQSINDKGVRLAGRDSWLNFSRYAKPGDIDIASVGDTVELRIDGSGFVRGMTWMAASQRPEPPSRDPDPEPPAFPPAPTSPAPSKDVLIVRQTALKCAAEFAASRPGMKCTDVLTVAQAWAAWVFSTPQGADR